MISVIVPTYNSEKTLSKALESIYDNDFKDFEVIVIDDASIDSTHELIKNYPVIYEKLEKNRGAAFARNRGVQLSKGEIILFIDADMEVKRDLLGLIDEQYRSTDYDVITGPFAAKPKVDNIFLLFLSSLSNYNFSNTKFAFSTHLASMRKEVFEEIKGFDERFYGATVEDFDFYHRLVIGGYKCKTDMRMEAYHYHGFTFTTYFRRMFIFGLLKTPLILQYGKNPKIKNQEERYLVNSEYILSYLLIVLLIPSLALILHPKLNFVILFWLLSYLLVKWGYLKLVKEKRLAMFLLLIATDGVVLAGCLSGVLKYYKDKILTPRVMTNQGSYEKTESNDEKDSDEGDSLVDYAKGEIL